MGLANRITGKPSPRKVQEDDLTPAMMAPPAIRQRERQKLLARMRSGKPVKESLIPSNADRIRGGVTISTPDSSDKSDNDPDMPELPGPDGMFPVATALIAPDVMPDLFKPLSPSKIPSAPRGDGSRFDMAEEPPISNPPGEDAMDTLLNRDQDDAPVPATPAVMPNVEALLRSMGSGVEDGLPVSVQRVAKGAPLAETLYTRREPVLTAPAPRIVMTESSLSALTPGGGMPAPGNTDPGKTVGLFRDYYRA